jgi:hypothetical protein
MTELNTQAIHLANQFADATIDKWGTDEDVVFKVLKEVHDQGIGAEFEAALEGFMDAKEASDLLAQFKPKESNQLTHAILGSELSGSALQRAKDMLLSGNETYSASNTEYFVEGLSDPVDLSSTTAKVVAVGGTVALGGAALFFAPEVAIIGGFFVVVGAVAGTGIAVLNAGQALLSDTDAEAKENIKDMGKGVGMLAMSAPFAPKGLTTIRAAKAAKAAKTAAVVTPKAPKVTMLGEDAKTLVPAVPKNRAGTALSPAELAATSEGLLPRLGGDPSKAEFYRGGLAVGEKRFTLDEIFACMEMGLDYVMQTTPIKNGGAGERIHIQNPSLTEVKEAARALGMVFEMTPEGKAVAIINSDTDLIASKSFNSMMVQVAENRFTSLGEVLAAVKHQLNDVSTFVSRDAILDKPIKDALAGPIPIKDALAALEAQGINVIPDPKGRWLSNKWIATISADRGGFRPTSSHLPGKPLSREEAAKLAATPWKDPAPAPETLPGYLESLGLTAASRSMPLAPLKVDHSKAQFAKGGLDINGERFSLDALLTGKLVGAVPRIPRNLKAGEAARFEPGLDLKTAEAALREAGISLIAGEDGVGIATINTRTPITPSSLPTDNMITIYIGENHFISLESLLSALKHKSPVVAHYSKPNIGRGWGIVPGEAIPTNEALVAARAQGIDVMKIGEGDWLATISVNRISYSKPNP